MNVQFVRANPTNYRKMSHRIPYAASFRVPSSFKIRGEFLKREVLLYCNENTLIGGLLLASRLTHSSYWNGIWRACATSRVLLWLRSPCILYDLVHGRLATSRLGFTISKCIGSSLNEILIIMLCKCNYFWMELVEFFILMVNHCGINYTNCNIDHE